MLSIVTVNWNSYDWLDLLIESIRIYTTCSYEIVVVDNSETPIPVPNVCHIQNHKNIGHGAGLNLGVQHTNMPYVMFLDVDCHVLCHGWEQPFLKLMQEFDVIGGKGVPAKPIRPACLCLKQSLAKEYDWQATKGYCGERGGVPGFDVAIKAYHQMLEENRSVKLLEPHKSHYKTVKGEEYEIDGKRLVYHNWSSTYLKIRQHDFPNNDLFEDKKMLFSKIPWRTI